MKYSFFVNIGDWSDDGHGKCDRYMFKANYPVADIQAAYEASVKLTGVDLSSEVCSTYEDTEIDAGVVEKLKKHGLNVGKDWESKELVYLDEDVFRFGGNQTQEFAQLLMWFSGLSMPDGFACELVPTSEVPNFNGFWSEKLNASFGYGLYY